MKRSATRWRFAILHPLCSILALCLTGCALLGVAANALPKPPVKPVYAGFAGQSVAVMVWADRGARIDFPGIPLDTATAVQTRLTPTGPKAKPPREFANATFPYLPASVVRYQREHPEADGLPIAEVAPRLGVSRLIYVEVEQFQTRSDSAVDLFRGTMVGTVRVVEVANGVGKVAYEENDVRAEFPKKAQAEGVPDLGDSKTYAGTVEAFAQAVVDRFVEYAPEER